MRTLTFIFLSVTLLTGCTCGNRPQLTVDNNTELQLPAKLIRFDRELFAIAPDNLAQALPALQARYGTFFTLYSDGILNIGSPDEEGYVVMLSAFLSDPLVREAYNKADSVFANTDAINAQLASGFEEYTRQIPNSFAPKVYAYVSGFNQPLMLTDSAVGVSLDMFLGRDCAFYPQLGIPRYKSKNMYKERIAGEVLKAWAIGDFPFDDFNRSLLECMLNEGRLLYLVQTLLPKQADTVTMGYTADELAWCEENEAAMWMALVENKLLFEKSYSVVQRMMGDAPFTAEFSPDSPGRATHWMGYRIVRSYMKSERVSLLELMAETDFRKMLERARYNPK